MLETKIKTKDDIVMKLLHYFIIEKNYNPVILHGAQNEIWLENMEEDYKIVRIVSNYIHNDEQLDFDLFKTRKIVGNIKRKTFNLKMDVLSIFTDLGENVNLESAPHIDCVYLKDTKDLHNYSFLYEVFPDIDSKLTFTEEGVNLFIKITNDINEKNKNETIKAEKVFTPKKPIITYMLIGINILVFLFSFLFNKSDFLINAFSTYGPYIRMGEYYRLITGSFVHVSIFHIAFNMYALYVIGSQVESFFGKIKFLFIYLFSAITASLLSMLLNINIASIGASGAIFGLMGAILYFGYYYRVYVGNTLIKQIVPIILLNLLIGFSLSGIDNFAHIGGLIGGLFSAMIVGVPNKSNTSSRINGIIYSILFIAFLIFMNFFYVK